MKVLDLFSGTRSISRAFEEKGHETFSVDYDRRFLANAHWDLEYVTPEQIIKEFGKPDVIWASPDCTTFSIAAISHHRRKNPETGNLDPVSDYAKKCDRVDKNVMRLIEELNPKFYFIENPRGGMRKMEWMQGLPRYTVTYCFSRETEIITDSGTVRLGDVEGKKINVLDGAGNFVPVSVKNYGKSKLMKLVLTRHGVKKEIYATPNHRWFASKNKKGLIETKDLKPGYRLDYKKANNSGYDIIPEYVARGFVFGDGYTVKGKLHAFSMFVEDKQELLKYFAGFGGKTWSADKNGLSIKKLYSLPKEWKLSLPSFGCSKDELYSWLIGYFSADGSVNSTNYQVTISSSVRGNLEFVQQVCDILGIGHYEINEFYRTGYGKEETALYQLTFMRSDLSEGFFIRSKHKSIFSSAPITQHQPRRWTVESVEETERYEDVFCCEVPTTQSFVLAGGILTHNCQYGDTRMKPTDIWTNHPDPQFKPPCHNGDPCHERAPRGSKTGTQGLKGSVERSRIPQELCEHIVDICEKGISA